MDRWIHTLLMTAFYMLQLLPCVASGSGAKGGHILDHLFDTSRYSRREWPLNQNETEGPLLVNTSIYTMSISSISEISMDLKLDIFLRQIWTDPRLAYPAIPDYDYIMVPADRTGEVWVPDTFIRNEKENYEHSVTVPNKIMRLYPSGQIFFSQRLGLKLSCEMDLRLFPFDNQTCFIQLESLAHDVSYIKYQWSEVAWETKQKTMPEFAFSSAPEAHASCDGEYSTGDFSCVEIRFTFKREFGYYIIQTYIPTILIVILSWVSFWLDVSAVPARISVGLLTVLNLTTISSGLNDNLPKVSYIKAIDVWMFGSQVFVFGAMLEFAIANVVDRRLETRRQKMMRRQSSVPKLDNTASSSNGVMNPSFDPHPPPTGASSHLSSELYLEDTINSYRPTPVKRAPTLGTKLGNTAPKLGVKLGNTAPKLGVKLGNAALKLDRVCKYAFPACYSIFFIVYWIYYLYKSGNLVQTLIEEVS